MFLSLYDKNTYFLERYISVSTFLQPIGESNHDKATLWHKTEEATGGVLLEKVFLEISPNYKKTPVPESLF